MTFQWSDFCDIALFLRNQAGKSGVPEEAAFRCAISRAYYSAFRHALNCAKDNGDYIEPYERSKNHGEIRRYYQKKGNVRISTQLGRLHQLRKEADYEDYNYQINQISVDAAIKEAQKILTLK